ncbi:DUF92 domain-containing protein [Geomicrobium sp. JCM 19039]|uniref:DUF92 domain-containing protein n=1 Tax=Geomicrobium sp. JCM 19039 TaxID=1460636 RepID=UPI00045F1B3C|nr:DUF92 domain-containing protein [Geomicrobium sp. JCM 19039]GAK14655.1 hypothetical protein JCM19039_4594 [Geomicrobium sp. JCM 19039]
MEFILVIFIALAAQRVRALSLFGALSATGVGFIIAYFFSWEGLIVLGVFFVSSTVLGRLPARTFTREKEQRTAGQVLANGGVAAGSALLYPWLGDLAIFMFIASLAAAASDTWATELGRRFGGRPYHLRKRSIGENGLSGAVSIVGTYAALVGSFFVSFVGWYVFSLDAWSLVIMTIAGFVGSIIDTVIGAYVQEERKCRVCQQKTESLVHCRKHTTFVRGVRFLGNNSVNTLCTLSAVIVVWIFA